MAGSLAESAFRSVATYLRIFGPAMLASAGFTALCLYYPHQRQQSLKMLARRRHLEWLGDRLPAEFPVDMMNDLGARFYHRRLRNAENVMSGREGSDWLLAFDGVSHSGSGRFTRTWVARRISGKAAPIEVPGGLIYREEGEWRAVARRSPLVLRRTMSAATIEEMWQMLGDGR